MYKIITLHHVSLLRSSNLQTRSESHLSVSRSLGAIKHCWSPHVSLAFRYRNPSGWGGLLFFIHFGSCAPLEPKHDFTSFTPVDILALARSHGPVFCHTEIEYVQIVWHSYITSPCTGLVSNSMHPNSPHAGNAKTHHKSEDEPLWRRNDSFCQMPWRHTSTHHFLARDKSTHMWDERDFSPLLDTMQVRVIFPISAFYYGNTRNLQPINLDDIDHHPILPA